MCRGIHYFTGPSQARTHQHPQGMWCSECSRDRTLRDGLPVAHWWDFEARLIADALIAVGNGGSYRKAAQAMRIAARRYEVSKGAHSADSEHPVRPFPNTQSGVSEHLPRAGRSGSDAGWRTPSSAHLLQLLSG
ncbi:MAG: hypothetical protein ACP5VP_01670 [Candidatus Limnocylindrales bacterium]